MRSFELQVKPVTHQTLKEIQPLFQSQGAGILDVTIEDFKIQ